MQNQFVQQLIDWFNKNKRDLPWRSNRSFYRVWISEIMLQQTQVQTVIPYFNRFVDRYPDIYHFAEADLQDILKLWEGLGYYNRIKNAHKAAQIIVEEYQGNAPDNYSKLIKLPGFGPYTTAAILSFAYKKVHAVVDGNVIRVIARLFRRTEDFRYQKNKTIIQSIVDEIIPTDKPDQFNEALMELGALICTPKNPSCNRCPLSNFCQAFQTDAVDQLPVLSKRKKVPIKKYYALIVEHKNKFLVEQRNVDQMLGGMWEFPVTPYQSLKQMNSEIYQHFKQSAKRLGKVSHIYSHFKLELIVVYVKLNKSIPFRNAVWLNLTDYERLPSHGANQKVYQVLNDFISG
ncbi:MAG: A/G-specific adenine glycosylase [Calditrichaeota bacterium]|nr:A/G-specific adenine glycosylase [Calditrichota bacterium]